MNSKKVEFINIEVLMGEFFSFLDKIFGNARYKVNLSSYPG